jgi:hypothetical protein
MHNGYADSQGDEPDEAEFAAAATEERDRWINHMVLRFLAWKLPENWHPDGGISFEPILNAGSQYESKREPTGTNLFDYTQAKAMVLHMIDGVPPL